MNKQINNKIVPKLRFPEFRDKVEWEKHTLGSICISLSSGKDISNDNGIYNLYGSTGIIGKTSSNTYDGNFILVARVGANAGLLNKASEKFGATDNTLVINLKKTEKLDFIYYSLDMLGLNKLVFGSGQPLITGKQLKDLDINLPLPHEQQKIASCLSSLDELISAQNQKLDTIKVHKNGLMQSLFPTEGETIPKLRFPEFRNEGEWSYLNGNEVFAQISNKNHNSDLPFLAITQEHGAIPRNKINYNVIVSDKSVESYKVVEIGEFIISLRSFQGGIEYSNYKGICSPAYIILRKKNNVVDDFFKHYFKTKLFIQDLNKNIEGIRDGKMVSYKQFSELLLPFPFPDEQQKIADCLSSLDELITVQSQKLEALKVHKKGLMQQLFPNVEEENHE